MAVGGTDRDATADGGANAIVAKVEWLPHNFDQAICQIIERSTGFHAVDDDGEFVTAEPCQNVSRPKRCPQPLRRLLQQKIADAMAQRIVDELKTVETEEQNC